MVTHSFKCESNVGVSYWSAQANLNSIFDPTGTFSTAKPAYYSQMVAIYQRYLVLGGRVTLSVSADTHTSTPSAADFGACVTDQYVSPTSIRYMAQAPHSKQWTQMLGYEGAAGTYTTGVAPKKHVFNFDIADISALNGMSNLIGAAGGNPSSLLYFIFIVDQVNGVLLHQLDAYITIEQDVILFRPIILTPESLETEAKDDESFLVAATKVPPGSCSDRRKLAK